MTTSDQLGRPLSNLRLSVTDRCNLRCAYCMPEAEYRWLPTPEILSFEEISALTDVFVSLGVDKVRLTGGEPLVRRELFELVRLLATKPELRDLAMTTNGVLLADQARALREAGLRRITVSLDTLRPERFKALTRRDSHAQVVAGIQAAAEARFPRGLKLDAVVMARVNDDELVPMLDFARQVGAEVRFIEYMDVGGATKWSSQQVVSKAEMLRRIEAARGAAIALPEQGSAPAQRYRLDDGTTFGIIASTTAPFCGQCDRARLTADGMWYRCLYATRGTDLKAPLRLGRSAAELAELIRGRWAARGDRGAEERLALRDHRGPLATPVDLGRDPHLEMHTRGG